MRKEVVRHLAPLIQREFTVAVPLQRAWDHLARLLGWLFAKHYRRNLERAIPLLIAEMEWESSQTLRHS